MMLQSPLPQISAGGSCLCATACAPRPRLALAWHGAHGSQWLHWVVSEPRKNIPEKGFFFSQILLKDFKNPVQMGRLNK